MFIRKGNVLINPADVGYVIVKKKSDSTSYNMTIHFSNKESLTWTYDTKTEADTALDEFERQTSEYVISELP